VLLLQPNCREKSIRPATTTVPSAKQDGRLTARRTCYHLTKVVLLVGVQHTYLTLRSLGVNSLIFSAEGVSIRGVSIATSAVRLSGADSITQILATCELQHREQSGKGSQIRPCNRCAPLRSVMQERSNDSV
jgi:hypothetical protein